MVVGEKECQPQDFRNIDSVSKKKRHVDCASLKKGCQQPVIRKWKTWYTFWMAELDCNKLHECFITWYFAHTICQRVSCYRGIRILLPVCQSPLRLGLHDCPVGLGSMPASSQLLSTFRLRRGAVKQWLLVSCKI
jgi:hypothetical protein